MSTRVPGTLLLAAVVLTACRPQEAPPAPLDLTRYQVIDL